MDIPEDVSGFFQKIASDQAGDNDQIAPWSTRFNELFKASQTNPDFTLNLLELYTKSELLENVLESIAVIMRKAGENNQPETAMHNTVAAIGVMYLRVWQDTIDFCLDHNLIENAKLYGKKLEEARKIVPVLFQLGDLLE